MKTVSWYHEEADGHLYLGESEPYDAAVEMHHSDAIALAEYVANTFSVQVTIKSPVYVDSVINPKGN